MSREDPKLECAPSTFMGYPRKAGIIALVIALSLSVAIAFLMAPFSP